MAINETMRCCVLVVLLFSLLLARAEENRSQGLHANRQKRALTDGLVFTAADKKTTVQLHNAVRRSVSPSAADMTWMIWDDRLAQIATDYSRKCVWAHNPHRSVNSTFPYVGENIFLESYPQTVALAVEAAVKSWESEKARYDYTSNTCKSGMCGHYTQLVWASSYAVGCGVSTCSNVVVGPKNVWPVGQIVVCNYGPGGNYPTQPYKLGAQCSACPKGFKKCKKGLCKGKGPKG